MQMFNAEHLQEKWAPILDHEGLGSIKDSHRRMVTAVLLENQERALREEREFLYETPTVNTNTGAQAGFSAGASSPVAGFDPVLISLIRRSMPNLVAYDLAGVQPMNGPTGLIFAMR
ncbi:MAG: ATP-binding protein, partial [Candidatus Nanopelagicaceae bacterium]